MSRWSRAGGEQGTATSVRIQLQRYPSFLAAAAVGLPVTVVAIFFLRGLAVEAGAIAFFLTYLLAVVARLPSTSKEHLRAHADQSDVPGYLILLIALATLVTAAGSLFVLLNRGGSPDPVQLVLGMLSVTLGWLCIHTMLAFHYAYEYYGTDTTSPPGKDGRRPHVGGLDFPGSEAPDGLSFVYFSFVVAMTAQVSDVTVTSNRMRRLVLLHGILAFFFNTAILATAVNVVVALAH
ncbi:MAG: DUF1345 domain-containing protein [Devosia sp.]|nr:DUF1345 domain-containing protein [Devosia sp.]